MCFPAPHGTRSGTRIYLKGMGIQLDACIGFKMRYPAGAAAGAFHLKYFPPQDAYILILQWCVAWAGAAHHDAGATDRGPHQLP